MLDGSPGLSSSSSKHTFNTLARESTFRSPPSGNSISPILNEFVAPHIESFNALFDDSGLPSGDGDGRGLLSLAIKNIGERVAFDGAGQAVAGSTQNTWGNRLSSKNTSSLHVFSPALRNLSLDRAGLHCATYGPRQRSKGYGAQDLPSRGRHPHQSPLTSDLSLS
jgi:hypothetical protein